MRLEIDVETLLEDLRPDITEDIVSKLFQILMTTLLPWETDTSQPSRWVRKDGLGRTIAFVDTWLGGYGDPHDPEKHGVGYKVQRIGSSAVLQEKTTDVICAKTCCDHYLKSLHYFMMIEGEEQETEEGDD